MLYEVSWKIFFAVGEKTFILTQICDHGYYIRNTALAHRCIGSITEVKQRRARSII